MQRTRDVVQILDRQRRVEPEPVMDGRGLLAWVLPMAYVAFCQYALIEMWRAPWAWPVRPPADRGAWIAAAVVYAAGLLAITLRGARQTIRD